MSERLKRLTRELVGKAVSYPVDVSADFSVRELLEGFDPGEKCVVLEDRLVVGGNEVILKRNDTIEALGVIGRTLRCLDLGRRLEGENRIFVYWLVAQMVLDGFYSMVGFKFLDKEDKERDLVEKWVRFYGGKSRLFHR